MRKESGLISLAVHGCAVAFLFTVVSRHTAAVPAKEAVRLVAPNLAPYVPPASRIHSRRGGGGGGDRSPTPATKGRAPKFSPRQFVPPAAVVHNASPKLLMDPTLIRPPDTTMPNNLAPIWGDPLAKLSPPSNGPGSGAGIGSGSGGGIGPGRGAGFGPGEGGGIGDGVYKAGGGVSQPIVLRRVEPEYTEEARK